LQWECKVDTLAELQDERVRSFVQRILDCDPNATKSEMVYKGITNMPMLIGMPSCDVAKFKQAHISEPATTLIRNVNEPTIKYDFASVGDAFFSRAC